MRTVFLAVGLACGALPAWSETCTFTLECFENEACLETAFAMDVTADSLVTDAETIAVSSDGSPVSGAVVGFTTSAVHVLTRTESGEARYSTHHLEGPFMVNYIRTCEG